MALKTGKLSTGFKCKIDEAWLDDMELVEDMAAADAGDVLKYPAIITKMLGADQKQRLYDHLRDKKTGRVAVEKVGNAILELLTSIGEDEDEGKNS